MRSSQKTFLFWAFFVVLVLLGWQMLEKSRKSTVDQFNFPKFIETVERNEVESVTFDQQSGKITGTLKESAATRIGGKEFSIVGNTGDETYKYLRSKGITPNYSRDDGSPLIQSLLVYWLPFLIIFFFFFFIMRQMQIGGGKALNFGKSRARLLTENKNRVTFKDVAGVDEAKEELEEIIEFLKEPKKFTKLGGRIPKGVLLVGPPGTGKTLLARAVAGEAGVPFFTISGSDFVEMFVGVGASRVRDLFEQGKKHAPCLIFIDEIDAVGRHRGAGLGGGHDEREQTLNQLLVEMDGFESNEGVILIAATNRPDVLDPALLRPGRFDRRVIVGKPDLKGRLRILEVHTKRTPLSKEVELERIARGTPGFSGADLENLVNEAALIAARQGKVMVDMDDFEVAKDKVIMGSERKSMVVSEQDRKITAFHEAGHTLVGKKMPGIDPVHKVSIIPRGMALGVTQTLPEEDQLNLSRSKAKAMIAFLFGGRVAEEVVFGDFTTGAENDIQRATEIARKMVCEWGMSDKLGPLSYEKTEGPVFLGMNQGKSRDFSESTAQEIDQEIRKLITEGHQKAHEIIRADVQILNNLAGALLEKETIDGVEVDILLNGGSLADINRERDVKQQELQKEQAARVQEQEKARKKEEEAIKAKGSAVGGSDPVTA
ncbi:MAG: cell division protein FtsH [Bdellovibrionales bacterium CG10_big_fil_rev_8_21_14_0_10_45_34]|nr:MAG: cell division protein FtsH [Bdellovibrionales bacterium CG10_big_fil_rev_8_21_14_0_10_45_34]